MLIKPEVRKLANRVRTVEDPITVKAKAAMVCTRIISFDLHTLSFMMKIYPKLA